MEASALTTTHEQLVVGDIPAPPPGLQPRPALLAQLNRASQKPPVVLTGIWGTGKTQLAATYARARLADSWRLIAWINARNSETLLAGLTAVAEAAGIRDVLAKSLGSSNHANVVKATIAALRSLRRRDEILKMRGLRADGEAKQYVAAS